MTDHDPTVLVTGGTGFLGGWCLAELLRRGYTVRTTVRDLRREPKVRSAVAAAGVEDRERLSVVVAELTDDDGWKAAVDGCRYVLHVASPFPATQPKDPDELIMPARDGALRVLLAAIDGGVERVVLTSALAAIHSSRASTPETPYTEADWTDGADTSLTPYTRSKTIAEAAAWELAQDAEADSRLATVNPGAIIGPVLGEGRSYSLQTIERLLHGMAAVPHLGFPFIDVRDVADLHLRAMTEPAGGGQRFIAADRFLWLQDVAATLRKRLGDDARKVPTRVAPNLLVRAMALFDPALRSVVGDLGRNSTYSSAKARTTLGWTPRPIEDSIEDCARSLLT
jgi:nucleoside-diphosphate-sugar epimerase